MRHTSVCDCKDQKHILGLFLHHSHPHFLRQGLSLNWELTNSSQARWPATPVVFFAYQHWIACVHHRHFTMGTRNPKPQFHSQNFTAPPTSRVGRNSIVDKPSLPAVDIGPHSSLAVCRFLPAEPMGRGTQTREKTRGFSISLLLAYLFYCGVGGLNPGPSMC